MSSTKFRAGRDQAAVVENIETLTGQRGDGRNRAVTYGDLAGLGLANLRQLGGGKVALSPGNGLGGSGSGGGVQKPTKPTGFKATGGFAYVLLEWDMPNYRGRSLTEIYRSPDDNLADAVLVASSAAGVYGDPVDPGWSGYYWVRHVNSEGDPGPFNDVKGTHAQTHPDPAVIIDVIRDQLNASPLIENLSRGMSENKAAVQTNNEIISKIDKNGSAAYQSLWNTKAQAGDIKAGIGIVAGRDANGNTISQVAVAASQFFIFDPNNPNDKNTYAIPFAVSDGKVVIDEAVMRTAVIKILAAQSIIADSVRAGIQIVSPYIKTARIESGNFNVDPNGNMTAKNAKIEGEITATSGSFTGTVYANDGVFRGTVYATNGVFRGKVYVEDLEGDIVKPIIHNVGSVTVIPAQPFKRTIFSSPVVLATNAQNGAVNIYFNGSNVMAAVAGSTNNSNTMATGVIQENETLTITSDRWQNAPSQIVFTVMKF
ncbi:DUF1983 domain-containing protein [Dickeya chrysanthemi]|uniref:phage tail tip fiber protein n=1 Tax=Dickeya chrysanthemi TaxID=556 RepID=UPI00039B426C|nr:DUF1983 domain-containing protein [Dickeya chrysanthemi]